VCELICEHMISTRNNNTYDMLTSAEKTPGIDEDRRIKVAEVNSDIFMICLYCCSA